jgi:hypothetical protein
MTTFIKSFSYKHQGFDDESTQLGIDYCIPIIDTSVASGPSTAAYHSSAVVALDPVSNPTVHKDYTQSGAQITRDNDHWNSVVGNPLTISFGFRTSAPGYTVNGEDVVGTFSAFTSQEQTAARAALALWADTANITFIDLGKSNNATIEFANYYSSTDNSEAFAFLPSTPGNTSSSSYEGDMFMNTYYASTTNLNPGTYEFLTMIHELGHTLGLEHPGAYNAGPGQTITYANNAEYVEDTRMYTVMSYFGETNTGGSFSVYDETPMLDDQSAIQRFYGVNTNTRTGDTVYGFNSNAGSPFAITSSSQHVTYMVYDSGGTDTFDFSGYSQSQTIDLRPEHFSSVGGDVYNVTVGHNVNIENAIGGSGNDLIITNTALAGTLTGGGGNDTFQSTLFGLSAYTISDLSVRDRLNFTDASLGSFGYAWNDTTLTYGGGYSLNLSNNPIGHLVVSTDATYGGLDLTLANADLTKPDFNGNHESDILWHNLDNGLAYEWQMNGNSVIGTGGVGGDLNWSVVGFGDFNHDGKSDILWRSNSNGSIYEFQMSGTTINSSVKIGGDLNWSIVGDGDLNGDGKTDILWRSNSDGKVYEWQMNGNNVSSSVQIGGDLNWSVVGIGDFNGDGKSDILWRNGSDGTVYDWQMNGNIVNSSVRIGGAADWTIAGVGDFNDDGKSDILWRSNSDGKVYEWQMNGNNVSNSVQIGGDLNWSVAATGDYNGDGKSDILWRNATDGSVYEWQMNGNAVLNSAYLGGDTHWMVYG